MEKVSNLCMLVHADQKLFLMKKHLRMKWNVKNKYNQYCTFHRHGNYELLTLLFLSIVRIFFSISNLRKSALCRKSCFSKYL